MTADPTNTAPKSRAQPLKMYLLSLYQPDGPVPPPETLARIMGELAEMRRELEATNSWVFSGGLHEPGTATVVRVKDGETFMTDGPFTEGKEHLGGFTIIEAPDLDVALEWGRRFAKITTLPVEVRPFRGEGEG